MRGTALYSCIVLGIAGIAVRAGSLQQTATLQGTVVDLVSGQRLPNAQIYLTGSGNSRATTDESGRFVITDLSPGDYKVEVSLEGYFWLKGRSGPSAFTVRAGDLRNVSYSLTRGSAISGRVLDFNGETDSGIGVAVYRAEFRNGIRSLAPLNAPVGTRASTSTDRRGEYRLYGLEPDDYYLVAGGGETLTYYPGTPNASAAIPLNLAPGRDLSGVNIALVRSRLFAVTVEVPQATDSLSVAGANFRPRDPSKLQEIFFSSGLRAVGNDRYVTRLKPGEYELVWTLPRPPRLSGRVTFDIVDHDVDLGRLELSPNVTISGRVQFSDARVQANGVRIQMIPAASRTSAIAASLSPDGTFTFSEVTEGEYWLDPVLPREYRDVYVQSVRYGRRVPERGDIFVGKISEGLLEIVLGAGSTVSGTVRNARGEPAPYSSVLLYAASGIYNPRSSKTAETDQYGNFVIPGVAPGQYRAVAWESGLPSLHLDPEFQRTLTPRAMSVVVRSGSSTVADLRLTPENQ